MVCRHVIVINYGYYYSADLRSIWPPGCLQSRAASTEREQLLLPGQLGSQNPGSCPSSRSSPAPWPAGLAANTPSQRARLRAGALLPPNTACRLPGKVGMQGARERDRHPCGEQQPAEHRSGKAGCKTEMSFYECFQAMDLAL